MAQRKGITDRPPHSVDEHAHTRVLTHEHTGSRPKGVESRPRSIAASTGECTLPPRGVVFEWRETGCARAATRASVCAQRSRTVRKRSSHSSVGLSWSSGGSSLERDVAAAAAADASTPAFAATSLVEKGLAA
eukprot:7306809-Prymnesium_polylepis.1